MRISLGVHKYLCLEQSELFLQVLHELQLQVDVLDLGDGRLLVLVQHLAQLLGTLLQSSQFVLQWEE